MPVPSPFHERTAPLCTSWRFKDWAGYGAVCSYDSHHDGEYFAIRESAGLLDVTPLFKAEVQGPEAASFLSRVLTRDVARVRPGRVVYGPWCDDAGRVLDDGTVTRLGEKRFRVTSADPCFHWLLRLSQGYRVSVEDTTRRTAALALQGPTSRAILDHATDGAVGSLRFFGATAATIAGVGVDITRTGYTGDLGYEIWIPAEDALPVWDALVSVGRPRGLHPAGLDALDMTRIEAGFILQGVDYTSAARTVLPSRLSTPWEIGLGWAVQLERGPFIGREALLQARRRGPARRIVGLELDADAIEELYERHGLPAALPPGASRDPLPVYAGRSVRRQVGRATSHTFSPLLKKAIALASVETGHATPGTRLDIEHTVEFQRHTIPAVVVETPFFDPERKKSMEESS